MSDGILVLEQRHMISTMLYLLRNEGCMKTDLYRDVSSNPRMPEKLDLLECSGLIRQERNPGTRSVRIYLTDAGRSVGDRPEEIDGIIQ